MISSEQIRAARAILNLSQKELAERAGISLKLLNNIEAGTARPRRENIEALRMTLEKAGIEFLDGNGVRQRGEALEIEKIEGDDLLGTFYADILKVFPTGGGEVLYMGVDNRRFEHYEESRLGAYKAFEREALRRGIGERLLFLEGDTSFLSERNIYRWVPEGLFGKIPMAIYGDNVSVILWGPPSRMVIIRNKAIAETFRGHFEAIWSLGKPVSEDVFQFHRVRTGGKAAV